MNEETLNNILDHLKNVLTYGQIQHRNNVGREVIFAITQNLHLAFAELLERLSLVKPGMKSKQIMEVMRQ
jgi:hypothetical protein